jgi:hypothetical protein
VAKLIKLLRLTPDQLSLALQILAKSSGKEGLEVEVPPELEDLTSEDWLQLDEVLEILMLERGQAVLH